MIVDYPRTREVGCSQRAQLADLAALAVGCANSTGAPTGPLCERTRSPAVERWTRDGAPGLESTPMGITAGAWQYAAEWGSLAMAVLAVIAVLAGMWYTTRTLRQAANQFEKGRAAARTDKLRAEIIDLTTALSARPSRSDIIVSRITERADKMANPATSTRPVEMSGKALVASELSMIYRRIYGHAVAVVMLSDDEDVADPVRRIMTAADHELEAFQAVLSGSDDGVAEEHQRYVDTLHHTIQGAMLELVDYGMHKLRAAS